MGPISLKADSGVSYARLMVLAFRMILKLRVVVREMTLKNQKRNEGGK